MDDARPVWSLPRSCTWVKPIVLIKVMDCVFCSSAPPPPFPGMTAKDRQRLNGCYSLIDLFTGFIRQRAWWEGRISRWLAGIAMSVTLISSDALSQQSLQELESSSQFERALRAVDAIKHQKKLQCIISTANAPVCECLAQKLPVDTSVRSYVSIVNPGKDGQDYGQLSAADRAIVDGCVTGDR